jgi:hypothetical protein
MSLNNLANRLSDLGRREEALAAAQEAEELPPRNSGRSRRLRCWEAPQVADQGKSRSPAEHRSNRQFCSVETLECETAIEPAERNAVGNHHLALLACFRGSQQLT